MDVFLKKFFLDFFIGDYGKRVVVIGVGIIGLVFRRVVWKRFWNLFVLRGVMMLEVCGNFR